MKVVLPASYVNAPAWARLQDATGRAKFLRKSDLRIFSRPPRARVLNRAPAEHRARLCCQALGLDFMALKRQMGHVVAEPAMLIASELDVFGRVLWLLPEAQRAWRRMAQHAAADGLRLLAISGFRSMEYQTALWQRKLARGQQLGDILKVSAPPGFSEHHSGRALDLNAPGLPALERVFAESVCFRWLEHHAPSFGFRMSYPEGNAQGFVYEPWHWYWTGPVPYRRPAV